MNKKALVVGAGIAGCCVAIALLQTDWTVSVIEKQPEWRFQSSGIFVYSNGLAAFDRLGVMDDLVGAGWAIHDGLNVYLDHEGKHIVDAIYPAADGARIPPILGIKRAEMHRILSARLLSLGVEVRLGTTIDKLSQAGAAGAMVLLSDGSRDSYDLVVGADGIRSGVRQLLWPDVAARYTGFGVWRSVHERPDWLRQKIMMMGPGKRLGIMPISQDRLYLFGTLKEPAGSRFEVRDWPRLMREKFAQFADPARSFLQQLGPGSEVLYTAVEEVFAPLPWHRGCVMLLGDAAHASTPFMGQGGAMAVEDAVTLAQLLSNGATVSDALDAFAEVRAPVCRYVQDASRRVGELGGREDAGSLDQFAATAQGNVDAFYARLVEFAQRTAMVVGAVREG